MLTSILYGKKGALKSKSLRGKEFLHALNCNHWRFYYFQKRLACVFFIIACTTQVCYAKISIQSITVTPSSCENNGIAIIVASSTKTNPILLYEIIKGPGITPIQNNPVFSSLLPGTYTIRLYDVDFEHIDQTFAVTGNYVLPDLRPKITNPFCPGTSDGQIIGQAISGKGTPPFSWEITSSTISIKQTNDIFNNLSSGSYSIKMTDACGNYQTRVLQLPSGGTGLSHYSDGNPDMYKSGCNKMLFTLPIKLLKERAKDPLTLTIRRAGGSVYTKTVQAVPIDTIHYVPGIYSVVDTISNITYGDYLSVCIKDICGYEICTSRDSIALFEYDIQFNTSFVTCNSKLTALVIPRYNPGIPYTKTAFKTPISLTLYDAVTNALVDSTGCDQYYCNMNLKEHTAGHTYRLNIADGCGQVFTKNITWPTPTIPTPEVQINIGEGCMDSTSVVAFTLANFGSIVNIKLLSGPATVKSTKPGYVFSDHISYPQLFFAGINNRYTIKNMPAGIYTYSAGDTCGNTVTGTFEIKPSNLANFTYSYYLKKGCIGDNILHFNPISNNTAAVFLIDAQTQHVLYTRIGAAMVDSIISPDPGKYILKIYYGNSPTSASNYNSTVTDAHTDCWILTDTIFIPSYTSSIFKSSTSIWCNNISYVEIQLDSSRGVLPFQYEIINGPKTFPLQDSNIFQLPTFGDYTIRIRDGCGNSTTKQISVDSSKFAPIVKIGSTCRGNKIILKAISSSFFNYEWRKPNGILYAGDSLIINALSSADTGTYTVIKNVSINGCTDRFLSSYHVELNDVFRQSISFCQGSSVHIGKHDYNSSGVYYDTLKNISGCDSIIISTLNMITKKIDTNHVRICNGEHITVGTKIYNTPGMYKDSVQNISGCYDITITDLVVNGFPDTIKTVLCIGSSLLVGMHTYTATGIYTDTLISSFGCDSIIVSDLTILPLKYHTVTQSICEGERVMIGTHTYTQSGIYYDTLTTTSCDSIVTLQLTVKPYIRNALTKTICAGESITVGLNTYYETGNYSDTLTTFSCDSIVTLDLIVKALPEVFLGNDTSFCSGQSLMLDAGKGFSTYYWNGSNQSTDHTIHANSAGSYWVHGEDSFGCSQRDTMKILFLYPPPNADAGQDTTLCYGKNILLTATGGNKYIWTQGDFIGPSILVNPLSTTIYFVTVYDVNQCSASDNVQVFVYPNPAPLFSDTSIVHCFDNDPFTLTANWGESFNWQSSAQTTPSIQITSAGTYILTATDVNACSYSDQVIVTEFCETKLFVPTAFSPNGDGLNDVMEIFGQHLTAFKITVYNRWGEIIFISSDVAIQWDGIYKGEQMPIGTYPWTIRYQNSFDEKHSEIILNGSVTLVR